MNYIIYLIIPIIVILFSLLLFSRATGTISPTKINTVSYLLYTQVLPVVAIGSLLVANNVVDHHYVIVNISSPTKLKGLYWALYSLIMMPLSMILLNKLLRVNIKKRYSEYLTKEIILQSGSKKTMIMWLFSSISLFSFLYILLYSPSYPLMTAIIKKDLFLASVQRIDTKYSFRGIVYIKNLLGLYLVPVLTYFSYCYYYTDKTKSSKYHFLFQLLLTFLILTFDTQKAPIVIFMVGFLIVRSMLGEKLNFKTLLLTGFGLLGSMFIAYIVIAGQKIGNLLRFDSVVAYRLFVGQIAGYFLSLEWFPNVINKSTVLVGLPTIVQKVFNLELKESARLLMEYFNPEGIKAGTAGIMNSYYLGEAWANYGYIGLIIAPIIVGFTIQAVHLWLLRSEKTPLNIAFYAGISIKWLIVGGIVNFLYLKQIIFPVILYIFIKYLVEFIATVASKGKIKQMKI